MWLPKEERDLLAYYYKKIGKSNEWKAFYAEELTNAIGYFKRIRRIVCRVMCWLKDKGVVKSIKFNDGPVEKVQAANERLQERGFIELRVSDLAGDEIKYGHEAKLTLQGWDIGRKYNCFFTRSGLWFAEYKNHWLWFILCFLGGIIGAVLVNWLSKIFV
jgi:hypothetical protein